jgi:hypothetical protein
MLKKDIRGDCQYCESKAAKANYRRKIGRLAKGL